MIIRLTRLLAAAFALAAVAGAHAAAPKRTHPAPAAAAAPARDVIAYENLHGYLGDRISVHTTFGTTRTGRLARFTQTELTLTIETAGGDTELSIPKDTIASMVAAPAAAPAAD